MAPNLRVLPDEVVETLGVRVALRSPRPAVSPGMSVLESARGGDEGGGGSHGRAEVSEPPTSTGSLHEERAGCKHVQAVSVQRAALAADHFPISPVVYPAPFSILATVTSDASSGVSVVRDAAGLGAAEVVGAAGARRGK